MNDADSRIGFRKEIEIKPWGTVIIELCEGEGHQGNAFDFGAA